MEDGQGSCEDDEAFIHAVEKRLTQVSFKQRKERRKIQRDLSSALSKDFADDAPSSKP